MTKRYAALAAVAVVAAAATHATAAPKHKPISKKYTATAATPDPTNVSSDYSVCAQRLPGSFDKKTFKAPAAGKLVVTVSGYTGDWDLLITDKADSEVTASGSGGYGSPANPDSMELASLRIKKPGTYHIIACNWAGSPTATVSYTFTYA